MKCRLSSGQCLPLSRIVILTSLMSAAISLTTIIFITTLLTLPDVWSLLIEIIKHWILRQQWDLSVSINIYSLLFMHFNKLWFNLFYGFYEIS